MYNWGRAEVEALQVEKAPRLRLDWETQMEYRTAAHQSIRRRLARTLVQLSLKIDPIVGE